jgi:hypothetical protein
MIELGKRGFDSKAGDKSKWHWMAKKKAAKAKSTRHAGAFEPSAIFVFEPKKTNKPRRRKIRAARR